MTPEQQVMLAVAVALLGGAVGALIVNQVWFRHAQKLNREWSEFCQAQNKEWAEVYFRMIGKPPVSERENASTATE